ncbi:MAG: hemerythrin domain-containing protein [Planctomycetes bacterium]|nr:hemerythrin domain-containing protein [Planctomycetota bacterium]
MPIYERLIEDHHRQRVLLGRIVDSAANLESRRRLWQQFRRVALCHADAEEMTLYAQLEANPTGMGRARLSMMEHKEAAEDIERLDEMDMASPEWMEKFQSLERALRHHMKEEEEHVFPLARTIISEIMARDLARSFDERRGALA